MKRYDSVDLFADLTRLVDENVKDYQSDFDIDKDIFLQGYEEKNQDFIWFTRPSGTGCVKEKDAYINGTYGFNECIYFLKDPSVNAYFVHVDGKTEDKLVGSILAVNAQQLWKEIMENRVKAEAVQVIPKEGEPFIVPYDRYNHEAPQYGRKYGEFKKNYILSGEDARKLALVLLGHKEEWEHDGGKNDMPKNPTFKYLTGYGEIEDVRFEMNMYTENNNLYLGLEYYEKEDREWEPYGNITVNVGDLPYLYSALDTNNNNEKCLISFLTENGFGKLTGLKIPSGFCEFPVFQFSEEKLKEVCPMEFEVYQKAYGKDKQKNQAPVKETCLER